MHNLYFPPLLSQFSVVTLNCTFLSQLPQNVSQPLWKSIQHFLLVSPLLPAGVPMSEQSKKLVCLLSHWSQDSQQGLHLYWFPVKQHLSLWFSGTWGVDVSSVLLSRFWWGLASKEHNSTEDSNLIITTLHQGPIAVMCWGQLQTRLDYRPQDIYAEEDLRMKKPSCLSKYAKYNLLIFSLFVYLNSSMSP